MIKAKPVSRAIVSHFVLPPHTNPLGTVFGGQMMAWIDVIAVIAACRHSQSVIVTASIDALHFIHPVHLGWIVNFKASVNFAGRTSMEVGVRVEAENPIEQKTFHTASAYLTFVAMDSGGKPQKVPSLLLETEEDRRRYGEAEKRRQQRIKCSI